MKAWGGRFKKETARSVEQFSASIGYDQRLYKHDIEGSLAHVMMLGKCGIIKSGEQDQMIAGLGEIYREFRSGNFEINQKDEDIHLAIERALISKIGPLGGKMHTARSRNDQVALDLALYLREEVIELKSSALSLCEVFIDLAVHNKDVVMPGYTHLQRAQSVPLSHHLLAYHQMFRRDVERLEGLSLRLKKCPLGAGALAGTSFPIDRGYVAKKLGFDGPTENSIDTVSDRDGVLELHSVLAIMYVHLSRLAEEIVLWTSDEFKFLELDDAYTTGSSIMPQKKNPDVAELVRGKTGRMIGNLVQALTMLKGLPLAYNRDLQEDKEALFDSIDTAQASISVINEMLKEASFNAPKLQQMASEGFLQATELADYLAKNGLPFREAHEIVGRIVRKLVDDGRDLRTLKLEDLQGESKLFKDEVLDLMGPRASIENRVSEGAASFDSVSDQIARGAEWLIQKANQFEKERDALASISLLPK